MVEEHEIKDENMIVGGCELEMKWPQYKWSLVFNKCRARSSPPTQHRGGGGCFIEMRKDNAKKST